jgi:predicted alpha/beta superfamily hydrolase
MTKSITILLVLISQAICANAFYKDSIFRTTIRSTILNQERELIVHFPSGYDPLKKHPVLFVLDGSSQDQHISDKFDSLHIAGKVPQVIIIGIPNMTRDNRVFQLVPPFMLTDPEKPESPPGTADIFLEFMEKELVPYVEKNFNTSKIRLFAGNSRGGLLVMYSLIRKPDLFSGRFCFSTPMWRQNNLLVSKVDSFVMANKKIKSFLFVSVGEAETDDMKGGNWAMEKTLKEKAPSGLGWKFYYTPGAVHQNNAQLSAAIGIKEWGEYVRRK